MTVYGFVVVVDCTVCKGEGWIPDRRCRSRGNEGALKRCYRCDGRKTGQRKATPDEVRALLAKYIDEEPTS